MDPEHCSKEAGEEDREIVATASQSAIPIEYKHVSSIESRDVGSISVQQSPTTTIKESSIVQQSIPVQKSVPQSLPAQASVPRFIPAQEPGPSVGVDLGKSRGRKGSSNSVGSTLAKGTKLLCYRMSDVAVSIFILLPLTIALWRGIWEVMNYYSPIWVSIVLGNVIPLTLYFFQETIKVKVSLTKMNFILFYGISRLLLLTHAVAAINQWRGFWEYLDKKTGYGSESAMLSVLLGIAPLIACKGFSNVLATPLFVGVDEATSVAECPLAFKSSPETPKWKYFLDCVWSAVIIQNLVVAAWRGVWNLATLHLYPDDAIMSAIVSLAIGTAITIVLCILQPCYFRFMIRLHGIMRLAVFDLVTMWAFIACVLGWRGAWDLYVVVTVFDEQVFNEWFLVVVGTVGTIILGCLSTVATRGITTDGEDSGDGTAEWPISYISLLQKKRHHGIPFPEPWLFRYLCTSQRMRMTEPLTQRRRSSLGPASAPHFSMHERQPSLKMDDDDPPPYNLIKNTIYVDHFDGPTRGEIKGQPSTYYKGSINADTRLTITGNDNGNKI